MSTPPPANDAIISPDTRRGERLPPRQALTRKWPVLHEGEVPPFDPAAWDPAQPVSYQVLGDRLVLHLPPVSLAPSVVVLTRQP